MFSHGSSSAYPPSRDVALFPVNPWCGWTNASDDAVVYSAMVDSSARLTRQALAEGQDKKNASVYGNYAIYGTPVEKIFGWNVERLAKLRRIVDPHCVMCLAGGWKV